MTTIAVGDRYQVQIAPGALAHVDQVLPEAAAQVLIVHSEHHRAPALEAGRRIAATGRAVHYAAVPDAEAAKTGQVAEQLWGLLGRAAFTRTDAVVGVGGGAVTDLAGFVAATWLRGLPVVQVPTTLLAMVDAAVGGKTGINTAEGKNLVGAFHEPHAVVCDLDLLSTLPRVDYVAGLAEILKAGFIADPHILDLVEADPDAATRWDAPVAGDLVTAAIAVKADVVTADLKESFLREILNYGHTFGHAIEQVEGYRRRHGEAVAVGMVYAAELAAAAGILSSQVVSRHREVLSSVGLPTAYADGSWPQLSTVMTRDKKARGSVLRFVVLEDIGRPTRLVDPRPEWLRSAYDQVAGGH